MSTQSQIDAARAWVRFLLPLLILAIYLYMLIAQHPALATVSQWATPVLAAYLSADGGVKIITYQKQNGGASNGLQGGPNSEPRDIIT
jgi:hypothetical protein